MMRLIYVIFLLVFSGCGFNENNKNCDSQMINEQVNFISKKYGIHLFGIGGFNDGSLKGYSLTFESFELVDVNQARALIVNVLEDIIKESSEYNNKCAPQLSYQNFKVAILFSNEKSQKFFPEDLGVASVRAKQGILYYSVDKMGDYHLDTIFEEPYSEAYEKIMGKKFVEGITQNSIN